MLRLLEKWRENLEKQICDWRGINRSIWSYCVPDDLLLAKLDACCVNENVLCYIYSYLQYWKNACESIISIAIFYLLFQASHKDL